MRRRFGLVERYAIQSLILTCLMAVILGGAVSWRVNASMVQTAGRATAMTVNSFIAHEISGMDITGPLGGDDIQRLDTAVRDNLVASGVDAIKIWDQRGALLYSSDGEPAGATYPENEDLSRALAGETVSEIVRDPSPENALQIDRFGAVMEVYSPLYVAGTNAPIGVFEVYESYAPIAAELRDVTLIIWGVVLLGAFLLYFTQLQIVRKAQVRLDEAETEVQRMNARVHDSMRNLEEHSVGTLQALLSAVDAKDSYTARHSLSVTDYALAIGRRLGLPSNDLLLLEQAGLLHDIGKIGISESILLKPSRLTPDERASVEEHSDIGARILESIPFLRDLIPIVRFHHERWDGAGYPEGRHGDDIPRLARVLAVADAFDAMMSDRPYRVAMHLKDAREELLRFRSLQFDPTCVDALLDALDGGELWGIGPHLSEQRAETTPETIG